MINLNDLFYILKWFWVFFVIGIIFLPITFNLFKDFKDKGYIFSKILGLAFISYSIFILSLLKIFKFNFISISIILLIFFVINYLKFNKDVFKIIKEKYKFIIFEEIIFFLSILSWSVIRSNLPEINGLEKFMDYGFLNSILRSDYFPPKDMWYTPLSINYYYFGHLITAVLTKITNIPSFITYNLMIVTLFALTLTMTFSLALNIFNPIKLNLKNLIAGLISAALVSLSGNLTTIYTFFKAYQNEKPVPFWNLNFQPLNFPNDYWYPNATRFIPFTIHEFPIYSFVVSDLHGHVLDIPFVLLTLGICFTLIIEQKITKLKLILLSFLLSIMYMTNAWDGLIYLLLIFLVVFAIYFIKYKKKIFTNLSAIYDLLKSFLILILGFIFFAIPFSANFKPFVSGIGVLCAPKFLTDIGHFGPLLFEPNHCQRSPFWQLTILYGFFYFFVISFLVFIRFKKEYKISKSDIFIFILIIISTLLLIVPEFIYIKDIYPLHYRANTMFKLSYEAFIMLSLSSGYILIKILSNIRNKIKLFLFFIISFVLVSLVIIYPYFAITSYYRNLSNYQGLNGINYLSKSHSDDYKLINWVNQNIKGQPVILEANGDSYTDYARISVNTGLPTVLGWSVHEWLWRGTYDIVSPRIEDVKNLYTSDNLEEVKTLLNKYKIKYVVISLLEKQKFNDINENNFEKLGKIIYKNNTAVLYEINLEAL
jgi:uncharacterized membrane protein